MHPFPHRYVVSSIATPDGNILLTSDGIPSLATATPPEFDGPGGLWSPETLLVASVADCFLLTFRGIARASRMSWLRLSVLCDGRLERIDGVTQFTRFDLRATVVLPPEASEDQARRILTRAEETCLITRSLKGETHLQIEVKRAPARDADFKARGVAESSET
jgi:organic hydroperoxide reductase OsmC/OhrA